MSKWPRILGFHYEDELKRLGGIGIGRPWKILLSCWELGEAIQVLLLLPALEGLRHWT